MNFTSHRVEHLRTDPRSIFSSETLAASVPRCDSFVQLCSELWRKSCSEQHNSVNTALERDLWLFAGVQRASLTSWHCHLHPFSCNSLFKRCLNSLQLRKCQNLHRLRAPKNTGSEPAGFKPMRVKQEGKEDEREMRMKAEMIQAELNICFLFCKKDNVFAATCWCPSNNIQGDCGLE